MTHITDHLANIRARVDVALRRSNRVGETVTIIGISKRQPPAAVVEAAAAGLTHFGENYLQEGMAKIDAVELPGLHWHFIGTVQSNKTRVIAENFAWVDTVDRSRIAERLDARRPVGREPLNVLIQLNLDDEPQKGGVGRDGILPLAEHIAALPRLRLRGLFSMPPAGQQQSARRASFLAAAAEWERLRERGFEIDTLSMGMSGDFELAIECGATTIRIGTALFGERG